jgi:hypothetical protein
MAAAEEKTGTKAARQAAKGDNGKAVVADHETVGDGYLDGAKTQTSVKAKSLAGERGRGRANG